MPGERAKQRTDHLRPPSPLSVDDSWSPTLVRTGATKPQKARPARSEALTARGFSKASRVNTCLREEVKPGESDTHPCGCDGSRGKRVRRGHQPVSQAREKRCERLASDVGQHGIRVNCVFPSAIRTERDGAVYVGGSAARGGGAAPAGEAGRARGRSTSDLVLGIKQHVADYRRHARRGRWQDHGVNRVSADGSTGASVLMTRTHASCDFSNP